MKKLVLVLLVIKCVAGSAVSRDRPLVSTPKGQIRGVRAEDGNYDAYYGIPYALVNEDDPFGPSSPHPDFEEIFDADDNDVICLQAYNGPVTGTLQCLQLNVYVPNNPTSTGPYAVMVYIHGGAFLVGYKSDHSPSFFINHDVIVVSINYRLGLHGFLCSSEPGYKNAGLKDQVHALKWIKENIAGFGGDADKITIFGISAGAMSIDYHMYANENLAQRVILMSGTAMMTWNLADENDDMPVKVAQHLEYTGEDVKGAIEYLSGLNPSDVVAAADSLQYLSDEAGHPLVMPCIEAESETAIVTDYPVNLQPKVKGMDIMIGYANKEVMFMYPNADNLDFYRNYKFETELLYEFEEPHSVDTVRQFYIGDEQPNENLQDAILDYASDLSFVHSAERSVDKFLNAEANSVYKYMFTYEGGRNVIKQQLQLTASGASHGDDSGYIMDVPNFAGMPITEADQLVIDVMTKMWTDFAKYGNPTPVPTNLIPEWKPVDKDQRPYMNIGSPIRAESRVFNKRMAFWDLYYKLHGHKVKGFRPSGDNEEEVTTPGDEVIEEGTTTPAGDSNEDAPSGGNSVVPFTLLSIITLFVTLFR